MKKYFMVIAFLFKLAMASDAKFQISVCNNTTSKVINFNIFNSTTDISSKEIAIPSSYFSLAPGTCLLDEKPRRSDKKPNYYTFNKISDRHDYSAIIFNLNDNGAFAASFAITKGSVFYKDYVVIGMIDPIKLKVPLKEDEKIGYLKGEGLFDSIQRSLFGWCRSHRPQYKPYYGIGVQQSINDSATYPIEIDLEDTDTKDGSVLVKYHNWEFSRDQNSYPIPDFDPAQATCP